MTGAARTRNLEIRRCAIARLRAGPSDHPGMTEETTKNAPVFRGVFALIRSRGLPRQEPCYAAALPAEPSTTCAARALVEIGMLRGFLASGISRTRSTWSRPVLDRSVLHHD